MDDINYYSLFKNVSPKNITNLQNKLIQHFNVQKYKKELNTIYFFDGNIPLQQANIIKHRIQVNHTIFKIIYCIYHVHLYNSYSSFVVCISDDNYIIEESSSNKCAICDKFQQINFDYAMKFFLYCDCGSVNISNTFLEYKKYRYIPFTYDLPRFMPYQLFTKYDLAKLQKIYQDKIIMTWILRQLQFPIELIWNILQFV